MKCKPCGTDIDIYKPPFGAYFCKKNHVQCAACEFNSVLACIQCGDETKYKSPHFMSDKEKSSNPMMTPELQVPILRHITHTEKEENYYREVRHSFMNGEIDEVKCFRCCNELNSVRTLSAMIAKDLYTMNDNNKPQEAETKCDFRFQKIMRALRETGCPSPEQNNDSDDDNNKMMTNVECKLGFQSTSQLNLLYPQESQLRASLIKLTPSSSRLTEMTLKAENQIVKDHTLNELDKSENSSLNWANYQTASCMNLIEHPPINFPVSIEEVSLDRHPFHCPISSCVGKIFISDFNQHIIHDHPTLPLSKLKFGQFKELYVDVKLCSLSPYNIACFLMSNIVKNFSTPPLKDSLPMILMIGRYQFKEDSKSIVSFEDSWSTLDSLDIWLMGVVPEQFDIIVGVSIFSKTDSVLSRWYVDHCNPIQSNSAYIEDVFQNARRLVLSYREVQMLTNNFQEPLTCQVGLVSYDLKEGTSQK